MGISCLRGGQRDIWRFEAFCLPFSGTKGPPKSPQGSPMVLNGQTSVPWEVELKYSTMGWFHYVIAELYLTREVDKGIFDDFRHSVSRFQALKGPQGSPTVLNGQTSVPWEVEIKYSTMGILSITHLRGGQRNIGWWLLFLARKFALRAPKGLQWFSMDKLVCHEKSR